MGSVLKLWNWIERGGGGVCHPAYHELIMYEEYVHTYMQKPKKKPKYGWNLWLLSFSH
jgi:hypothetical protein